MSRTWLIAVAMWKTWWLSGDWLPWVVRGVRGVYCEFFFGLALEPAVGIRTLAVEEASSDLNKG